MGRPKSNSNKNDISLFCRYLVPFSAVFVSMLFFQQHVCAPPAALSQGVLSASHHRTVALLGATFTRRHWESGSLGAPSLGVWESGSAATGSDGWVGARRRRSLLRLCCQGSHSGWAVKLSVRKNIIPYKTSEQRVNVRPTTSHNTQHHQLLPSPGRSDPIRHTPRSPPPSPPTQTATRLTSSARRRQSDRACPDSHRRSVRGRRTRSSGHWGCSRRRRRQSVRPYRRRRHLGSGTDPWTVRQSHGDCRRFWNDTARLADTEDI